MTLDKLKINRCARIVSVDVPDRNVKRHLLEMGLTRGVKVCLKNIAPLGDPISIELRGYELAIRKADSRFISVEVIFR